MSQIKSIKGAGFVEFILIISSIAIVGIIAFNQFGHQAQLTTAALAIELAGGQRRAQMPTTATPDNCVPVAIASRIIYFDQRVDRYRNRVNGRFTRLRPCGPLQ